MPRARTWRVCARFARTDVPEYVGLTGSRLTFRAMAAAAASQPGSPRLPVDMDAETFAGLTALLGFRRVASSASLDADDAPSPQRRSKKKARSDRSLRDAGLQSSRYRQAPPRFRTRGN